MVPKLYFLLLTLALAACAPAAAPTAATTPAASPAPTTLTLVTHDSFALSEAVLAQFSADTGISVEVLRSGDAGSMLNQSILSRQNPLGDVLFGIDNTFLGRALENELFVPYESPLLADIPAQFRLDSENRVTPIDYGDVCLNYDVAYFAANSLPVPDQLLDLTDQAYRGLLVVQNPATSSPGLAFLLATIAVFGTEGDYTYLDFWRDLVVNQVRVVDGWELAYYGFFSIHAESDPRPLVVSYASSPPAEVYFAETPPQTAPTAAIVAANTCFRQIEFAGILQGTDNLSGAQRFIDFMLSVPFQEDLPLNMFVFPVNPAAALPEVFTLYAAVPESPLALDSAAINANRDAWISAWTDAVLR
ncbi:MAG: thiamine ABC transporter substrate-binding protein [Chloroflexi bacterium]|nr:thiamine ABC transporter substrate-binding protein [Chloroflexota bacterium]